MGGGKGAHGVLVCSNAHFQWSGRESRGGKGVSSEKKKRGGRDKELQQVPKVLPYSLGKALKKEKKGGGRK